ncbi:MAG TPA: helix-hairpin-helix domain-containing protein, partial [Candidatus Limnocylindria bacterium]|nr:helix-hairpin-helix domain-containing protein [Candidatus Limnocylindria bacterium]
ARNAQEALEAERVRWLADRGKTQEALEELRVALALDTSPRRIECYDVSHVQGTDVVASLVAFEEGRPARQWYRRFRIRGGDKNDDAANMREVLKRRFRRVGDDDRSWPQPDLVIVDGGKPQLSAARDALSELGRLDVPFAALAKEREELFRPERPDPIVLPRTSQGLYLVQRVRDEAHRFAVTYHRSLRAKRSVRSVLDEVPGVGPRRKRELMRRFGSVKGIREADVDEIAALSGISRALAERIKQAVAELTS